MNISELRIGNIVRLKGDNLIYTVININYPAEITGLGEKGMTAPIHVYEPVELTHEWLSRFGIDLKLGNYFGPLAFIYHAGRYLLCSEDNEYGFNFDTAIDISHVHQLQNLYFALTNKELTA